MIQIKLPIMFSKRITPEIVDQMIADERVQELLKEGVYIGPVRDIVTPEREALKQFMESLKKLAKDGGDVIVQSTSTNTDG